VHVVRDTWRLLRDLFRIRRVGRAGGYEISVADVPPTLVEPHRDLAGDVTRVPTAVPGDDPTDR
jgi:hypothetical protein